MTVSPKDLFKPSDVDEQASTILATGAAKLSEASLDSKNITEQNATNPQQVKDLKVEQVKVEELANTMKKAAKDPQALNKLKIVHEKLKVAYAKISAKIEQAHNNVDKKVLEPIRRALGFIVKKINEFFSKIKNKFTKDKGSSGQHVRPAFEGPNEKSRPMYKKSPSR